MEYRKLISFGKNSFVVSLPKAWVIQNKMKKGDLVYLEENGPNLVLSHKDQDKNNEESEKVILVDGKSFPWLGREVCSAYILNYRRIVLKGKEIKSKVKELQTMIQGFIALEIMEQTSDTIVAKDFLNMEKVSMDELIRKMDVVTRTMLKESCSIFQEENYENLNERDKDVNRLYFLLYRSTLYNLENPMKALKNFGLKPVDLLKIHYLSFYIEAIADEARRTARYARLLAISAEKKKEIETLLQRCNTYYLDTMKTVYSKNIEEALRLSDLKVDLDREFDRLEKDVQKVAHLNIVINRLRRMVTSIHNLGRIIYTLI